MPSLNLLAEVVELLLFPGVVPDKHRVQRDAAFLVALEAAYRGDPTAVSDGRDAPGRREGGVDGPVDPLRDWPGPGQRTGHPGGPRCRRPNP